MPGRDRTGPSGFGPMTGRRMGLCASNHTSFNSRLGLGFRRGYRRGYGLGFRSDIGEEYIGRSANVSEETVIENEIRILKDQLSSLEDQLKKLGGEKK